MHFEMIMLVAAAGLGLVHLTLASFAFKLQVGNKYTWGGRDEGLKPQGVAARLRRAQDNFNETFPIFAVLVLVLNAIDGFDGWSLAGVILYMAGRIAFIPLYWRGVCLYRTFAWKVATAGIALLFVSIVM